VLGDDEEEAAVAEEAGTERTMILGAWDEDAEDSSLLSSLSQSSESEPDAPADGVAEGDVRTIVELATPEDEAAAVSSLSSPSVSQSPELSSSPSSEPESVEEDELEESEPVMPPVAPVAAMRAATSLEVSHPMLVPAELTRGRAAQIVPVAHCVKTKAPDSHCAKELPMHACWPGVHDDLAVRLWNPALSFCAARPFCS